MATITEPMALDKTFNTTETTPRSQADVLAAIESAIRQGFGRSAADVSYDNTTSGLTADDVQEAIDELVEEKVDKVAGKGLSTNDYTDEDKAALDNMELDIESTQTISGNPLTLTDAAPINAESLVVELEPIQEGSGDPSPTNIRPITGYTECNVDDVGKNLFGGDAFADKIVTEVTGAVKDTTNKTISYSAGNISGVLLFDGFKPNTRYTFITNQISGVANLAIGYSDGTSTVIRDAHIMTSTAGKTVTGLYGYYSTGNTVLNYEQTGIFEGAINESDFEPYHSSNATIQFGQTVMGGKVNVTDGGTDKTYGYDADLGAAGRPWWAEGNGVFRTELLDSKFFGILYCSMYKGVKKDLPDDGEIAVTNSQAYQLLRIKDPTCVGYTAAEFAAHISGCQLAYELATPTQLSTPPTDLKLLKGTNNLSTNGTTINLGYQPDNVIGEVKGEIEKCAVDTEFMQFTDGTDTFTDVNLSLDASFHSVSVVGSKIEQKRFMCFEVMDKMGGALQGILASCIAFTDGAKTPSGTAFRAYIESLQMYVNFRIYGSGGSYTLAYQSESSFSASAFYVRVRLMNNL